MQSHQALSGFLKWQLIVLLAALYVVKCLVSCHQLIYVFLIHSQQYANARLFAIQSNITNSDQHFDTVWWREWRTIMLLSHKYTHMWPRQCVELVYPPQTANTFSSAAKVKISAFRKGINNIFSNQIGISGLRETWITMGNCMDHFYVCFLTF